MTEESRIEKKFMLGDWDDGSLEILSYLDSNNLIEGARHSQELSGGVILDTYSLKNNEGEVSIRYNKHFKTAQVGTSSEVPERVSKDLEHLASQSREIKNLRKYGVSIS